MHQGMMYQSALVNRDRSSMGQFANRDQSAMAFYFQQSSERNFYAHAQVSQQNFFAHLAHQAHVAALSIPPKAPVSSCSKPPRHSGIPVDVTVRSAGLPESSVITNSVKPSVKEIWNCVPTNFSSSEKPRANLIAQALHGGPHACCPSLKFRFMYSKMNGKMPYAIFMCTCKGSARIKAACVLPGYWRLFFNVGGEHSSTEMEEEEATQDPYFCRHTNSI